MDWTTKLRTLLGLPDTADEAAIWAALEAKMGAVATQSAQLAPIAKAVGLAETADGGAVLQAVQALQDPAKVVPAAAVTALQQQLSTLQTDRAKEKAELFVDTAIKAGRIAAPAQMRDHYIARHMADPTAVEKEIGAMPALHGRSGASVLPPPKPGETTPAAGLDPEEMKVISLMGIDPEAYRKTKAAQAEREGVL
jgi:phage I-like protein